MSRQRTTWSNQREAASARKADIYTMNQEHPQPSPTEYENGSPDSWAETPTSNKNIEGDYEGDHVKRNELNFGEMRKDTFDHKDSDQWNGKGKYDNQRMAAERKAMACERIARATLRTMDEKAVEAMATDLMGLPDQVLVATLRRLDQVNPDNLPEDRRYRRAMACCKLAYRMCPTGCKEQDVERLASVLMSIDDPTLKAIVQTVASIKVAEDKKDEEKDEGEGHAASPEKSMEEEKEEKTASPVAPPPAEEKTEETSCMTADDLAMLDGMLQQECAPAGIPAPSPVPAPSGELVELFAPPPAVAPMASTPPVQTAAGDGLDIHFDDEDEGSHTASDGDAQLDDLFSDHPEVQAQREMTAANNEQRAREAGYGAVTGRTASAGAKKLGNVQAASARSEETLLQGLWDRP